MARVRMVTRGIKVNECETMCVNTETCEVATHYFELTGDEYTPEQALKAIKKLYETDTLKVVMVNSISVREDLYGMLETDFLKVAHKLDDKRRIIEDTEE